MKKTHRRRATPSVRLPVTLAIGCCGDLSAVDEETTRGLILEFLRERLASPEVALYGICTLGGMRELVFAESCIELAIPLQILSPVSAGQHTLPQQLASRDAADRLERAIKAAISIEVITSTESPNGGFYECGIEVVRRSSLVLVFGDRESDEEGNSAAEVAAFAEIMNRPIARIDATGARIEIANNGWEQRLLHDPELEFLNGLPDAGATSVDAAPSAIARQWFFKVDANASMLAPQVRRLASIPIVYTAAAAVISGAASKSHATAEWVAIAASVVLGIVGAVLPIALRLNMRQALWARTRIAAEVCRSALAMWHAPSSAEVIGSEVGPELAAILASLRLLRMKAAAGSMVPVEQFRQTYREERILGQIAYFSHQAERADQRAHRYKRLTLCATVIAVFLALGWLADKLGSRSFHGVSSGPWFPLTLSALFQSATVVAALGVVHDSGRRRSRYKDLCARLSDWDCQFQTLKSWTPVLQIAVQVEKSLMVELLEWQSLARNTKLTGK